MSDPDRAQEVLERAASLSGSAREAYLREACAGDPALRAEVESLVEFYETSPDLLDRLAGSVAPNVLRLASREHEMVGRFEVQNELGRGGMGVVYRALDTRLDRPVALKFLPAHLAGNEEAKGRFELEARAASKLNHPNVCPVHELGVTDDGDWFIVMPLFEGGTLGDRLIEGPIEPDEAAAIIFQIASGLAVAHEAGIVHRDVKPANIMMEADRPIVMDFGVAKLVESDNLTQAGAAVGTMSFMSPEQLRGEELDARSDLWSLGVLFYEILTGRRPFEATYPEAQVYTVLNDEPAPLEIGRPDIEGVVLKLLEKDRSARFASAEDLIAALPVPTGTRSMVAETGLSSTRRPRWAWVTGASLVVVFGIWLWPLLFGGVESQDPTRRSMIIFPFSAAPGTDPAPAEYASFTIAEELAQLPQTDVAPSAVVSGLLAAGGSEQSVAEELGADAYVTGQASTDGDEIVLEVFMTDTRTDELVWSERYFGPSNELGLYSDVARALSEGAGFALTDAEIASIESQGSVNEDALRLYVQGRRLRGHSLEVYRAEGLLKEAVAIDSMFAPAWAELAFTYNRMALQAGIEYWNLSRSAATRALAIDSSLGLAWYALAGYETFVEWDWDEAEAFNRRASALAPSDPTVQLGLPGLFVALGRHDEVRRIVLRLKNSPWPLMVPNRLVIEMMFILMDDPETAIQWATESLTLYPESPLSPHSKIVRATAHLLLGDSTAAAADLVEAMPDPANVMQLGGFFAGWGTVAYAMLGDEERALEYVAELSAVAERQYFCTYEIGLAWGYLGDLDEAFRWMDIGIQTKANCLPFARTDPRTAPLRGDPRYRAMLDTLAFPIR